MELSYDWRSFQSVFYPQKRALPAPPTVVGAQVVFAVIERDIVIAIFSDGENLSDYIGVSAQTFRSALGGREIVLLEREVIDQWISGAIALPHLHAQMDHLRKGAVPLLGSKARDQIQAQTCLAEKHFLLDAILGRWSKLLPSAFGIFIRLEKATAGYEINPVLFEALGGRCKEYLDREQDILVLARGGKLEAFYEPDLSPMGAERRHLTGEVVKYLSEKHSVPVQGLSLPYVDWIAWNHSRRPWRQMAGALKSREARLYPLRWQVTAWLGLRAALDC